MADFYMHRMLIGKLQETTGYSDESTIGAQGPDFFYYVLGNHKPRAQKLGNLIHKAKTRAFLVHMLEAAIEEKSEAMLHYTFGFLSHHALDISIHPYIFYYTGLYNEEDPTTQAWAGLHLQFERKVDIAFIKHTLGIMPHKHKLVTNTLPLRTLNAPIRKAIDQALYKTFQEAPASQLFDQGYKVMRRIGRGVVYDPLKLKRRIIRWFESYDRPKNTYYQDLSHAQTTDDFDYLNLEKKAWLHPVTKASSQASVIEIFNAAQALSERLIKAAQDDFKKGHSASLSALLTNASYDTGIDCDTPQPMKHFKDYRSLIE